MRQVKVVIPCLLCGIAFAIVFAWVSHADEPTRFVWYLDERVIPMPYYPGVALETGVTGKTKFRVDFKGGNVSSVSVIESELTMKQPPDVPDRRKYQQWILDDVVDTHKLTLSEWSTPFVDEASQQVEIRLLLDDRLKPNERHFRVALGTECVP
jgi:hypothetical protein